MKAIMLYDFKEGRVHSTKMLTESAHSNESIWTNCILPLSMSYFMLFDKEKNCFIFERILLPTNDQEKFKLNLVGCIRVGEEVTRAVFGTLNIVQGSSERPASDITKQKSYMITKTRSKKQTSEDRPMEEVVDEERLKTDKDYVR